MCRVLPFLVLVLSGISGSVFAQGLTTNPVPELKYPKAKITESTIMKLDAARRIRHFDAAPDGSNWLMVDAFGPWESIVLNGERFAKEYHTIPASTAKVSPNGKYLLWMGLSRAFTDDGFNATLTTLYKNTDSITAYTSDYNDVAFSVNGKDWAALFPYANEKQAEDRNAVVMNGKELSKNGGVPKQFTFGPNGWAYRATDGLKEYLVTQSGQTLLRERKSGGFGSQQPMDSVVWHYAPYKRISDAVVEAIDFNNPGVVAQLHRTSYRAKDQKNALSYISYKDKMYMPSRWVTNVLLDTAGKNVAYFACDPSLNNSFSNRDERIGIVVLNGEKYDGPMRSLERMFLSPSGKNIAYSASGDSSRMILNKKVIGPVGQLVQALWSLDEKTFSYATMNNRGLVQVVVNGKISEPYELIGRMGWTKDSKFVEYLAVRHGKVIKVKQSR